MMQFVSQCFLERCFDRPRASDMRFADSDGRVIRNVCGSQTDVVLKDYMVRQSARLGYSAHACGVLVTYFNTPCSKTTMDGQIFPEKDAPTCHETAKHHRP